MQANQQHHALMGDPTPIITYRNDQEFLHWDGLLFFVLCVLSWILFAYLWARLHWTNHLETRNRPPSSSQKIEDWMESKHWRN